MTRRVHSVTIEKNASRSTLRITSKPAHGRATVPFTVSCAAPAPPATAWAHAEPPTMQCAIPSGKTFARESRVDHRLLHALEAEFAGAVAADEVAGGELFPRRRLRT